MTKPPDRTIRELVNDLYRRLDIASRPRCAEAKLLEQIGLAADALMDDTDDPRVAALEAKVQKLQVYAKEMEDVFLQEYGVQYGDYGSPDARRKVREEYGVIDILPDETEEW